MHKIICGLSARTFILQSCTCAYMQSMEAECYTHSVSLLHIKATHRKQVLQATVIYPKVLVWIKWCIVLFSMVGYYNPFYISTSSNSDGIALCSMSNLSPSHTCTLNKQLYFKLWEVIYQGKSHTFQPKYLSNNITDYSLCARITTHIFPHTLLYNFKSIRQQN